MHDAVTVGVDAVRDGPLVLEVPRQVETARRDRRAGLRADHALDAPHLRIAVRQVVAAEDVRRKSDAVGDRAVDVVSRRHGTPLRILLVEERSQLLRDRHSERRLAEARLVLPELVAGGPHHDAGMVAVAADEVAHQPLVPLVPVGGQVALHLLHLPLVERLGHHHQSQLVAEVQELRRGEVVRRANRVAAHLLQERQLPPRRVPVELRAEHPEVVMQANAADLAVNAVQEEALRRREAERPDAVAERLTADLELVEMRTLRAPQLRTDNRPGQLLPPTERHLPGRADDRRGRRHRGKRQRDRSRHDVIRRRLDEPHVAVDAEARIPAGRPRDLVGRDPDRVRPRLEQPLQRHDERRIAVLSLVGLPSVDEYLRMGHHAVELEPPPVRSRGNLLRGDLKDLLVLAMPPVGQAPATGIVTRQVEVETDGGVMRQANRRRRAPVAGELPALKKRRVPSNRRQTHNAKQGNKMHAAPLCPGKWRREGDLNPRYGD